MGGAVGGAVGGASLLRPVDGLPCGEGSVLESGVVPKTIYTRIQEATYQSRRSNTAGNSGHMLHDFVLLCVQKGRGRGCERDGRRGEGRRRRKEREGMRSLPLLQV